MVCYKHTNLKLFLEYDTKSFSSHLFYNILINMNKLNENCFHNTLSCKDSSRFFLKVSDSWIKTFYEKEKSKKQHAENT